MVKINMKNRLIALMLSAGFLTACDESKDTPSFNPEKQTAIIVNKAYGEGSQVALASVSQPREVVDGFLVKDDSDYIVNVHGEYFYHIGRKDIDTIQRYHIDSPSQGYYPNDGFVLRDAGEATSSNPQDIAFVNDQTAVITFLGKTEAWVVNPQAQTFEDFKIHELDLSAYAFNDGIPDAKNVEIVNGRAFISMQQVDFDNDYSKEQAYVAVFDTTSWEEIDTSPSVAETKAIALTIRNPLGMQVVENQLYIHGMDYSTYVGGLEVINPSTLNSEVIYQDNEQTGRIYSLVMLSSSQAYAIDYAGWKNNSFKSISINNDQVAINTVTGYENTYLTTLGKDGANNVWLGLGSVTDPERQPGVQVFTSSGEESGNVINTQLDPDQIVFLTKE